MLFVKLPYSLATEEAERIGLDHVAKISSTTDSGAGRGRLAGLAGWLCAHHHRM